MGTAQDPNAKHGNYSPVAEAEGILADAVSPEAVLV